MGIRAHGSRGISWTLDEAVACGFAEGHRGLRAPDAVLATGLIAKEHIFAVFTDRHESEVLLDPVRIRSRRLGSTDGDRGYRY